MAEGKLLNCIFWDGVACKHRKSETVNMMVRCWSCRQFKRFVRQMDDADAKIMEENEKRRSEGDGLG